MRIDKFLKVTRLIKRRTVAADACSAERILINGKEAKPAKQVSVGDVITVLFGDNALRVKITAVPEGNVLKKEADEYYELLS